MELILKQDVQNLGFKDDVVTVKNGYGRNYLIPQGFAALATPSAKKVLAENLKQKAKELIKYKAHDYIRMQGEYLDKIKDLTGFEYKWDKVEGKNYKKWVRT